MPAKKGQPRPAKGEGKSGQTSQDKLKGRHPVWLPLPPEEYENLRVAAALDGVHMTEFARRAVDQAARKRRQEERERKD